MFEASVLNFTKGRWKTSFFVRHVLCFLRQHMPLLRSADYKRLYDEAVDYLSETTKRRLNWNGEDISHWIILHADVLNESTDAPFPKFSSELVAGYLQYRKGHWEAEMPGG